jgi:hypothetical protein
MRAACIGETARSIVKIHTWGRPVVATNGLYVALVSGVMKLKAMYTFPLSPPLLVASGRQVLLL